MKLQPFFVGVILVLGWSALGATARADTDYQCLNRCVNSGKTTSVCLSNCSYNIDLSPSAGRHPGPSDKVPVNNHHLLSTPLPLGNEIKLDKPKHHMDAVPKDYTCMSACLKDTKIYSACEHQCTPVLAKQKKDHQRNTPVN